MNTTSFDLKQLSVADAMSEVKIKICPTTKLEEVAKLFQLHGYHSAPVVDSSDKCIGIITSHDLVCFQSELSSVDAKLNHGMSFDVEKEEISGEIRLVSHPFDEVERHMTADLQTVDASLPLLQAARIMCLQHIHHLIVLDESQRPIGILSSLDIIARLPEC